MNAHTTAVIVTDIAQRIQRAVEDLRAAVRDGTATDPAAAQDLADRMERYAESVLAGNAAAYVPGGPKTDAAG